MANKVVFACVGVMALLLLSAGAYADPVGHVTGVGGIFVKSKDPKALAAWYRDVLGIHIESWGGAKLSYSAPGHPSAMTWRAFPTSTDEMAPSNRDFMINLAVDDMDAFVARISSKGVKITSRDDSDPFGKFAAFLDPDGTKIEVWEPRKN